MDKIMTVDILSSIKGAKPSASVNKLFEIIKNANEQTHISHLSKNNILSVNELREDVVIKSTETEREIIKENFPKKKNEFLVVAKVIED